MRIEQVQPDYFVAYVMRVCEEFFGGKLPNVSDTVFVAALVEGTILTREQPQPVLDCFARGLVEAIDCIRRVQSAKFVN